MNNPHLLEHLAVHRVLANRPQLVRPLLSSGASLHEIVHAPVEQLSDHLDTQRAFRDFRALLDLAAANRELHAAQRANIPLVCWEDEAYPPLLREIPDPPLVLYVRGNVAALRQCTNLAIVGARRASKNSLARVGDWVHQLTRYECAIVSGLAFGIDAAAHRACIEANDALTVAVLASGVDIITPRSHHRLGARILDRGGALVSEYPLCSPSLPQQYPQRNRLISGLSHAVLIAECARRSGTMWTAYHAMEQGRPVMAIPGPCDAVGSQGPHALIRQGATLVTNPQEILELLESQYGQALARRASTTEEIDPRQKGKSGAMGQPVLTPALAAWLKTPRSLNDLVQRLEGDAAQVLVQITQWELTGRIYQDAQGYRLRHG